MTLYTTLTNQLESLTTSRQFVISNRNPEYELQEHEPYVTLINPNCFRIFPCCNAFRGFTWTVTNRTGRTVSLTNHPLFRIDYQGATTIANNTTRRLTLISNAGTITFFFTRIVVSAA